MAQLTPIAFAECNTVFGANQSEYHPLPAFLNESERAEAIMCFRMPFWKRFAFLFTGRIWFSTLTFKRPLNPILVCDSKFDLFVRPTKDQIKKNKLLREELKKKKTVNGKKQN
jgi:hypothetical protein